MFLKKAVNAQNVSITRVAELGFPSLHKLTPVILVKRVLNYDNIPYSKGSYYFSADVFGPKCNHKFVMFIKSITEITCPNILTTKFAFLLL